MQMVSPSCSVSSSSLAAARADLVQDGLRDWPRRVGVIRTVSRPVASLKRASRSNSAWIRAADGDLHHAHLAALLDEPIDLGVRELRQLGDLGLRDAFLEMHDQHAVDLPAPLS